MAIRTTHVVTFEGSRFNVTLTITEFDNFDDGLMWEWIKKVHLILRKDINERLIYNQLVTWQDNIPV